MCAKWLSPKLPSGKTARRAAILALAVPLLMQVEGLRTKPYYDIGGVPTVCYGETEGVVMGQKYTPAECRVMLEVRAGEFLDRMEERCIPSDVPVEIAAALGVSWAYNVGVGAACKSTLVKRLKERRYAEACQELYRWVYVKGKVIPGLKNRRDLENALCKKGIKK